MRRSLETAEFRMRALEGPLEEERRQRLAAEATVLELRSAVSEATEARGHDAQRVEELTEQTARMQADLRNKDVSTD
jgi:hypothetical protein